jgi:chlorite dismutase
MRQRVFGLVGLLVAGIMGMGQVQAADRERLLADPGVYATFAAFRVDADWWKLERALRLSALAEVKVVVEKHRDKLAIDTYLLRGLSDHADFMVRIHGTQLLETQNFLLDLMATSFGRHVVNTVTFNGLTKKANYTPGFQENLKAELKTPPDQGAKPYAIVIPVKKDDEWWILDQDRRTAMMAEHAEATVAYLKSVKRKLYHSSGLDDFDFITYFETARLEDFNNLVINLEKVTENRYNRRFGHPTLLGTVRTLDELIEAFAR